MKNNIKIAALFAALIGVLIWTSCNKSTNPTPTSQNHGVSQFRDDPPDPPTDCIEFPIDCTPVFLSHIQKTIQFTSDPVCLIDVEYDVWICSNNGMPGYVFFNNFEAKPNQTQCTSIWAHWYDLIIDENWEQLQTEMLQFLYDAQQVAEADYFKNEAWFLHDCGDLINVVYSDFYVNTCWKSYFRIIEENGIPKTDVKRIKCGLGCCRRSSLWCFDPLSGEPKQTVLGTDKVGSCSGVMDPVPDGYIPFPPPFDQCERDCKFYKPQ